MSITTHLDLPSDLRFWLDALRGTLDWSAPMPDEHCVRDLTISGLTEALCTRRVSAVAPFRSLLLGPQEWPHRQILEPIAVETAKWLKTEKLLQSGHTYSTGGGFMGWHSNQDRPGLRVYLVWSGAKGNFFRWLDPVSGQIHTSHDPVGWHARMFTVPQPPELLWHCVNMAAPRMAIGLRGDVRCA